MKSRRTTKKARRERARALIDANAIDEPFSEQDTALMNELLGVQFAGYVRRINPDYPTDPRHLHALDGDQWGAFSWNKAISPISAEQNVKRVMREIVREDMRDFLSTQDPFCAHCGASDDLTVDHTPPFDEIANEFIRQFGLPELAAAPSGVGNVFADENIEAEWILFHAARATYLQVLCRLCNSSKGKRASPRNKND